MTQTQIDNTLQWGGTVCFLCMYTLMSLNMYPYNIIAGVLGAALYLTWSLRVRNWPQTVTNVTSIAICGLGLFKAFG
jgi:hypothetical protein